MNIKDILEAYQEIKELLTPKECPNVERLQELNNKYGNIPQIKELFSKDYDRRSLNPGWGSENCSCHIAPPCQSCVDFTNAMTEEELENYLSNHK